MGITQNRNFYPTLAILCSITALILTSLSAFACWFVTVDLTAQQQQDSNHPLLPPTLEEEARNKFSSYSMGMWGRETASLGGLYCVLYSSAEKDYFFDAYWRASRAFSMIAAILGLIAMVATILHACTRDKITNRNLLPIYGFISIMQAFAFLAYGSNICSSLNCQYSKGSTYAIVAIVLYLMTGMFHFCIYKQEMNQGETVVQHAAEKDEQQEEAFEPEDDEEVAEETTVDP